MNLKKISYEELNSRAKEIYNFQKVSAVLADYGFATMWLNNDWEGADFIAVHVDGVTHLKVQLKGRLSFAKKYRGKNIHICFRENGETYLYPHDEVLGEVESRISDQTWVVEGKWSSNKLSKANQLLLEPYRL
ncbi:hypothetical protein [Thiosocius teredinicola]|uniref:hypothetical protein n=1 Tax=Thiosocius teredinicola TaxID=1973002 RepID=UPI000990DBD5